MEPIRERGLSQSVDAAKDTATKSAYDGLVRLGVKAKADHVTGYLQLETASGTGDNYNWGSGSAAGLLEGGYKTPGSFTKYSGLSNLSEYQINVSTKTTCPMTGKDLSLKASATYLDLNEETAAAANGGSYLGTDSDIGTELDAIATWSLAPGLVYTVEAAYMFVGDAWNTDTAGDGADPDDLYFLRHRIEYSF